MELTFHWIGGATFIMSIDDIKIGVDPVLCKKGTVQDYFWFKSRRIENPVYKDQDFENIDLWLITHNHEDHLDSIGLSKISNESQIICNRNSVNKLESVGLEKFTILKWKESISIKIQGYNIEIEAIPAIHGINPISAMLAGKVNGYYLLISKGEEKTSIYITSDTVYKEKIINSINNREIDILIPNMGAACKGTWIMTLTLDSKMLKKIINKLHPKIVIPVHYGTFSHYNEPIGKIKEIGDNRIRFVKVGEKININE